MNSKAAYVRSHTEHDGTHLCHGGCGKSVAPARWGCTRCWFRLPKSLRTRIWETYRPGQEIDKHPSPEYLDAAVAVQQWVKDNPLPAPVRSPQLDLLA